MSQIEPQTISHSWSIQGVMPNPDGEYSKYANLSLGIVAGTAERAITYAKLLHGEFRVLSVNHRGPINIIADSSGLL